ncbi:uncharacterized protein LOC135163410 [Diachasmimorpha longicaudata]|uniref:uncharacterized protein LOC135163410 n=1 Tax=Diachasmimorpha longicaudata TaxID=58733 RepID=UPI0030B8B902
MEGGEEKKRTLPLKYRGKFITRKNLEHKLRMKLAVAESWRKRQERAQADMLRVKTEPLAPVDDVKRPDFNTLVGSRIVDMEVLVESMNCNKCKEILSLHNLVHERRIGLYSVFNVWCPRCKMITEVHTGTVQIERSRTHVPDINREVVHGSINADISHKSLNQFLDSLDLPTLPAKLFKKHKSEMHTTEQDKSKECNGKGIGDKDGSMMEDNSETPLDNEVALQEDSNQIFNEDESGSKRDDEQPPGESGDRPEGDIIRAPDDNEIVDENQDSENEEDSQAESEVTNPSEGNSLLDENEDQQETSNS